jgi:hypothetical protein
MATSNNAPQTTKVSREGTLDRSKYKIDNLQYPLDLFTNNNEKRESSTNQFYNQQYLNYVVFYINVSEQSRVFTEGKIDIVGDVDKTEQNTIQGKQASISDAAGAAATGSSAVGGVLGAADGIKAGAEQGAGGIGKKGGVTRFLKGILGAGAGGAIKGAAGGGLTGGAAVGYGKILENAPGISGLQATQKIKRLRSAIALHVPNEVQVGYRATYGEEELGAIFGAAGEVGTGPANAASTGAGAAAIKGLEVNPARGLLSALYKAAPNPRKEQLFKSMEFRRFTFNYQFAPRSPEEAANVKRIINTFKFFMHPEFQNNVNKMLYLFPSEFDIVYYFGDKEHPHLNRISTCVLTDLQVNYAPNGQLATHSDGFPTQINVNMNFLELETMTKERFLGQGPDGKPSFTSQNFQDPNLPSF